MFVLNVCSWKNYAEWSRKAQFLQDVMIGNRWEAHDHYSGQHGRWKVSQWGLTNVREAVFELNENENGWKMLTHLCLK